MADVMTSDVAQTLNELRAKVGDARATYGDIPAVQRLANDIDRLLIDWTEFDALAGSLKAMPRQSGEQRAEQLIRIDDTPLDPAMWTDADDEGVGGFHGPHGSPGSHR